ncbi:hypothetical protein GU926_05125 [Nibribacter ruber]|uniref:Uncharacterized protein n=1 Tax=Nibribacter ruber TaxID=2698458 RepID=A0A6P1P145_9BACT|nr:hypothetical protein [Nibribacter ruber]QHL86852.1 hypothetical protein GU926_05125 [Nibribacter ruber]
MENITDSDLQFYALVWVFLSFGVAAYGNSMKVGFFPTLLASIFLSPVVGLIIAAVSGKKEAVKTCPNCGWQGLLHPSMAGFCPACGKNKHGKTKADYQTNVVSS